MARMRIGASWSNVCVLDISQRGLSIQAAVPPPRGTYLEVRRGAHAVVARVMWSRDHRFGVRTQDVLAVDEFIEQPDSLAAPAGGAAAGAAIADRRSAQRSADQCHENSKMLSRAMEYAVLGIFAAFAAVTAFGTVSQALVPLSDASAVLARD